MPEIYSQPNKHKPAALLLGSDTVKTKQLLHNPIIDKAFLCALAIHWFIYI